VRIAVLGPLEVRTAAGQPVEVAGARLRTLLVRLALDPGRIVTTGQLVDAVWADGPPASGSNALQALISRLRRAVPDLTVESHPAGYRLVVEADEIDAHRFERLLRQARSAPAGAAGCRREALALWRGPALADFVGADFARGPVARLTELRLSAVEDLAAAELATGAGADLVADLEALNLAHPTRERLAALFLRALDRAGRPADALAAYERVRTAIADELGVDPSGELTALHLALLGAAENSSATPGRTNLRSSLTSFVGRDADVRTVAAMVGAARLVTLVGPGGAGKTRLAVESARTLLDRHPDGVWLVELAPVSDTTELATTLLSTLGLREKALLPANRAMRSASAGDPAVRLLQGLRDKRLLIVLDNCEHLIASAAALADEVLGHCPEVRILATSREPLALTGETLWTVESLAVPPVGADPVRAGAAAAVRLLVDRAGAARSGFRLDESNVETVIDLVRSLDGMPLAIELAAARLRTMTVAQIAERLDDRFRLLVGGSRTALPRHQTLRAVVSWSWDLLNADEQALWRRLSIFAGGAGADAIEAVGDLGPSTVDTAYSLAEKSLLAVSGDARPRFGMLETIKAYGRERLGQAGEEAAVRARYVAYYVALAEQAEPFLRTRDQLSWLDRLRSEHDNLHAAVRLAIADGDTTAGLRLIAALGWYWWLAGHRAEGADLAEAVVHGPDAREHPLRAHAQSVATLSVIDGNRSFDTIREWIAETAELAAQTDLSTPALRVIGPLQELIMATEAGRPVQGFGALVEDPDPWVRATAHLLRSHAVLNVGGDGHAAEADMRAARAAFGQLGERWGLAASLSAMAEQASRSGDREQALVWWRQALGYMEELDAREDVPQFRLRLARELWLNGDLSQAGELLDQAQREAGELGVGEALAVSHYERAELLRARGDLDGAGTELAAVTGMLADLHVAPQLMALLKTAMGHLDLARGQLAAARTHHEAALELAITSTDSPIIGHVVIGHAALALAEGRPRVAATLLGAATGVRGAADHSVPDRARVEQAARAALGDDAYTEAYQHGLLTKGPDGLRALTNRPQRTSGTTRSGA
jgi:predicted ATPase/DNA-binding SARP family transcriptional activator/tetratricopeptide (TPR) repeat protein